MCEKYIIKILKEFKNNSIYTEESSWNFILNLEHNKYKESLFFLEKEKVIFNFELYKYKLTDLGFNILKDLNNWKIILENENLKNSNRDIKEQVEFEKSKIDLELAKKMLKEYPKTKLFARIGLTIGIVLWLKELYIWLMQLLSK
jgi:predicted transcriptional regulator